LICSILKDKQKQLFIVRIQSIIRGFIARRDVKILKKKKTTEGFNSGMLEINEEEYNNPVIMELLKKVG
jgi:hypothetical protein